MAVITLHNKKSRLIYELEINGTPFTLLWKKDLSLMFSFINELEISLNTPDKEQFISLSDKYQLQSDFLIITLAEKVFLNGYLSFLTAQSKKLISEGIPLSPSSILRDTLSINSYQRADMNLLNKMLYQCSVLLIKDALVEENHILVKKIIKSISLRRFLTVSLSQLYSHFEKYLNKVCEELFVSHKEVTWKSLWNTAFGLKNCKSLNKEETDFFTRILNRWSEKQDNKKAKINMKMNALKWNLPYKDIQSIRIKTMDFSKMPMKIRLEIQEYINNYYKKGESPISLSRRFFRLNPIVNAITSINTTVTSFLDLTYVEVLTITDILKQQKNKKGGKNYSLKSIQGQISEGRMLFDWLCEKNGMENLKNPLRRYKFHNINAFVKHAEYIPEEVIEQLSSAIRDCPQTVQRVWLIMINTGFRVANVLDLEENCLIYNEKESCYYLRVISKKTLKSRRKAGRDDFYSVPLLSEDIVDIIKNQISETEHLRNIGNTNSIFIRLSNQNRRTKDEHVSHHLASTISNSINNCIKRHGIKNKEGELWNYTHHQCRKTLAVKLLTEGSSISDVAEILDHIAEKTTRTYYQDVDAMKIAKLDYELFEMLFNSIDTEISQAYSLGELDELRTELLSGSRETPEGHGNCLKHVSFGPCRKKSCVGCSLLLTGPQKLPMWRKLYSEQKNYINTLVITMQKQGISEFESYRDYQAELNLLLQYENTILKIEKFLDERGLVNESFGND
ncbi:integrase [Paenibacillus endophyticus]|uniref:Integrase n=1 Tax=Paenibacillus endophyticus TaxID=1294268 RepID=A0A7W5GAN8_9BACL|nr:tyrosine-type recombinase/integrase [Paenibacillus endophyticus]MBB3152187.1 integrase [Paenibacillus endophyticus]